MRRELGHARNGGHDPLTGLSPERAAPPSHGAAPLPDAGVLVIEIGG